MKINPLKYLGALCFAAIGFAGCTGSGGTILFPDISNFAVWAPPTFVPGTRDSVSIQSSSLTPGPYEVCYYITGANLSANDTALILMNGGSGSFMTPILTNPGNCKITLSMIINNSSGYSSLIKKNTANITDSTGTFSCLAKDSVFKVTDVNATLSGTALTIKGTQWSPLDKIYFTLNNYTGAPGTTTFNAGDATSVNGSAGFSTPTTSVPARYGTVAITAISPVLRGTFSFTCAISDSTRIANGTFSCPAP